MGYHRKYFHYLACVNAYKNIKVSPKGRKIYIDKNSLLDYNELYTVRTL